jgi:hypothetical protein
MEIIFDRATHVWTAGCLQQQFLRTFKNNLGQKQKAVCSETQLSSV